MPFSIGENVGPYRIIEQLGHGGMATVYKAYHAALDRYVAIKVLHPAFMEDPTFLKRFQREARLIAKLEHPNIVPIYDYAEHEGQPYLVLKYIEGETLKMRLARGPIEREEEIRIVRAVGAALSYAHGQNILHRDIKPSNILLAPDGKILLADFGLARIAEVGASTISADMFVGTPQYISPEQARGERNLDSGTDIYSFGVVLYEMVVGRVPFNSDTPLSIVHDHIYSLLPLPSLINPSVSEAMERVLLKALTKDRRHRFGTVDELVAAFCGDIEVEQLPEVVVGEAPEEGQTVAPASSEAGGWPAVSSEELPLPPAAAMPEGEQATPRKGRRQWPWVVAGVTLCCIVLAFLGAAVVRQWRANREAQAELLSSSAVQTSEGEGLLAARATALANPGDARSHIQYAEVLFRAGLRRQAIEELKRGADLHLRAGEYEQAAQALNASLEAMGGLSSADAEIQDMLVQALWMGSSSEAVRGIIDMLHAKSSSWKPIEALLARTYLYLGDPDQTDRLLTGLLSERPEDLYAKAAYIELLLVQGEEASARELERSLLGRSEFPSWMAAYLRGFSGKLEELP
jgi:tRNA A-37 threonylcarbamoyl transferase component Bud32